MTLTVAHRIRDLTLNDLEVRRIQRRLRLLERLLRDDADPIAVLTLERGANRRQVRARLRLRRGHLGGHLVGDAVGDTADHAVRLAADQLRRQIVRGREARQGELTTPQVRGQTTGTRKTATRKNTAITGMPRRQ